MTMIIKKSDYEAVMTYFEEAIKQRDIAKEQNEMLKMEIEDLKKDLEPATLDLDSLELKLNGKSELSNLLNGAKDANR